MEPKRRSRVCWFLLFKIPSSIPTEFQPWGSTLGTMHYANAWCHADIINFKFQAYHHLLMTHSSYHSVNFIQSIKFQPLFMLPISDSWVITCGFLPGLWDEDLSLQLPDTKAAVAHSRGGLHLLSWGWFGAGSSMTSLGWPADFNYQHGTAVSILSHQRNIYLEWVSDVRYPMYSRQVR